MGKMILCVGTVADNPFPVPGQEEGVYSIEELCWYIHEHIYTLTAELFDAALPVWLEQECHLPEAAEKVKKVLAEQGGLKELVRCLLSSTNYDTRKEREELLELLGSYDGKSVGSRIKQKADHFLSRCKYGMAARIYKNIISGEELYTMQETEYGNLLHNYGIALLHISSLKEASVRFMEAYGHNRNEVSLKYYIWALELSRQPKRLESAVMKFSIKPGKMDAWLAELANHKAIGRRAKELEHMNEMKKMKVDGMAFELEKAVDEQLAQWKETFRKTMAALGE